MDELGQYLNSGWFILYLISQDNKTIIKHDLFELSTD